MRSCLLLPALVAAVSACNGGASAPAAPPALPAVEIAVTAADGGREVVARVDATRCTTPDGEVTRTGDTSVGAFAAGTLRIGPGRVAGEREIVDAAGAQVARVVLRPDRIHVLDPSGVPLTRVTLDGDHATITDAAKMPTARLARDGAGVAVSPPEGPPRATVTGTADLAVAAFVSSPGLRPDLAHLLACDQALAAASLAPDSP